MGTPLVTPARRVPDLKVSEAQSRSLEVNALPRAIATTPESGDFNVRGGRVRKRPAAMSHSRAPARPERFR